MLIISNVCGCNGYAAHHCPEYNHYTHSGCWLYPPPAPRAPTMCRRLFWGKAKHLLPYVTITGIKEDMVITPTSLALTRSIVPEFVPIFVGEFDVWCFWHLTCHLLYLWRWDTCDCHFCDSSLLSRRLLFILLCPMTPRLDASDAVGVLRIWMKQDCEIQRNYSSSFLPRSHFYKSTAPP